MEPRFGALSFSEYTPSSKAPWLLPLEPPHWLSKRTKLLAIGSCFAINFSRWISLHGVEVLSAGWGMHYNPATILHELRLAAGEPPKGITWRAIDPDGILTLIDARRHMITGTSDCELEALKHSILSRSRPNFMRATAFLITLGLSEVWEELTDGMWTIVNQIPPPSIFDPAKHRNRTLSVSEAEELIREIILLIRIARGPDPTIVLTVSPVPLRKTASGMDARISNCYSKSVLIAALHSTLARRPENVYYFPAYEMFWGVPPAEMLWQHDGRHPTKAAIEYACQQFVQLFAREPQDFSQPVDFTVKQV
jgi:hypothetical protein